MNQIKQHVVMSARSLWNQSLDGTDADMCKCNVRMCILTLFPWYDHHTNPWCPAHEIGYTLTLLDYPLHSMNMFIYIDMYINYHLYTPCIEKSGLGFHCVYRHICHLGFEKTVIKQLLNKMKND